MRTIKFKTNIQCGGCISTITPHLNKLQGISSWEVDTTNLDKILTIYTGHLLAAEVITALKNAGYRADQI